MTEIDGPVQFRFGNTVVDTDAVFVEHAGEQVAIEPQVFSVLEYLIEHRSRVVTKEELLDNVWGDRFVSESALTSRIKSARKAIGDDGRRQESIRTVHGRGYQFIAPVHIEEDHRHLENVTVRSVQHSAPGIMAPATELLGRQVLVDELSERVVPGALVSLIGPAGVGKTHLARYIGAKLHDRFTTGSWFVALADVRQPSAVADAILEAIGVTRSAGSTPAEAVVANLRYREGLLVLDNCEHVVAAAAQLVDAVRASGSRISILTTTRQRLGVGGERLITVPVLDSDAAIELFVDRVERRNVKIDPESALVRQVCKRLDHLPLALELVSAHTWALGIEQVSALLDDRMRLFEDIGPVDAHHRTLEQAITSSYEMLAPDVQQALCHFSVFAGSFDLNAAMALADSRESITGIDQVNHLMALVEASLLIVEDRDDTMSYRLLESVRLFASERIPDRSAVESAHLNHFCQRAEKAREQLNTEEAEIAFAEYGQDWDNYRAAVTYGIELGEIDLVRRLLAALVDYADMTQKVEHADWAERLLDRAAEVGEPAVDLASTKAGLARLLQLQDIDRCRELLVGLDPDADLSAAMASTFSAIYRGDTDDALVLMETMRKSVAGSGGLIEANVEGITAFLLTAVGQDPCDSRRRLDEIAAVGGPILQVHARTGQCFQAFFDGDIKRSLELAEEMIDTASDYGLELIMLASYRSRDQALIALDDEVLLAKKLREAIEYYRPQGHWTAVLVSSPLIAKALIDGGMHREAAQILAFYNDAKFIGSRSQGIADLCTLTLAGESEELASMLTEPPTMSPPEFADYLIEQLTELAEVSPS